MSVLIIVGAGAASASVIEKVTDVDIGVIELAKSQGVEVTIMVTYQYDYLLTPKVNIQDIVKEYSLEVVSDIYTPKPFYLSFYNDDHRSDWLNKELLEATLDTDRQNQNLAYGRLRRVQHRPSAETQS